MKLKKIPLHYEEGIIVLSKKQYYISPHNGVGSGTDFPMMKGMLNEFNILLSLIVGCRSTHNGPNPWYSL